MKHEHSEHFLRLVDFLAFDSPSSVHAGKARSDREGILELTHNYGSEDKEGQVYHNGNKEPQGFGHIAFTVDNIAAACQALEKNGVKFQKKQSDGRQKNIAFALDPDNCKDQSRSTMETTNTTRLDRDYWL